MMIDFHSYHWNEDETKNIIENLTDIWIPQIAFSHVMRPTQDNLKESDEIIVLTKTQNGMLTGSDDLEQNYIHEGKTVRITKTSTFVGSFLCSFADIYKYPFDTEMCSIRMVMMGRNYFSTKIVKSKIQYSGKQESFSIRIWKARDCACQHRHGAQRHRHMHSTLEICLKKFTS